jgi:hypothetical protein
MASDGFNILIITNGSSASEYLLLKTTIDDYTTIEVMSQPSFQTYYVRKIMYEGTRWFVTTGSLNATSFVFVSDNFVTWNLVQVSVTSFDIVNQIVWNGCLYTGICTSSMAYSTNGTTWIQSISPFGMTRASARISN